MQEPKENDVAQSYNGVIVSFVGWAAQGLVKYAASAAAPIAVYAFEKVVGVVEEAIALTVGPIFQVEVPIDLSYLAPSVPPQEEEEETIIEFVENKVVEDFDDTTTENNDDDYQIEFVENNKVRNDFNDTPTEGEDFSDIDIINLDEGNQNPEEGNPNPNIDTIDVANDLIISGQENQPSSGHPTRANSDGETEQWTPDKPVKSTLTKSVVSKTNPKQATVNKKDQEALSLQNYKKSTKKTPR